MHGFIYIFTHIHGNLIWENDVVGINRFFLIKRGAGFFILMSYDMMSNYHVFYWFFKLKRMWKGVWSTYHIDFLDPVIVLYNMKWLMLIQEVKSWKIYNKIYGHPTYPTVHVSKTFKSKGINLSGQLFCILWQQSIIIRYIAWGLKMDLGAFAKLSMFRQHIDVFVSILWYWGGWGCTCKLQPRTILLKGIRNQLRLRATL